MSIYEKVLVILTEWKFTKTRDFLISVRVRLWPSTTDQLIQECEDFLKELDNEEEI